MLADDKLKSVYEEQLLELPAINQEALKSFDWEKKLFEIGRKYGLHIDQTEDFWTETMLVLVGLEPADAYRDKLMTELAIAPADAEKITIDVNTQIFGPIHDFIIRGGPVIEDKKQVDATEDTEHIISTSGVQIIQEHESQTQTAPVSFASMIKTGVIIPPTETVQKTDEVMTEEGIQNSLKSILEDAKPATPSPTEIQTYPTSEDAVLSLESLLENKSPVPEKNTVTPVQTTIATAPLSLSQPDQDKQIPVEIDRKLTALEKLQKMLAEEKAKEIIITTQEKADHTLGK